MAKLYITEHRVLTFSASGHPVQVPGDYGIDQVVDYTAGATQSTAFNTGTLFVRINTDSICSIAFGANPTATTSNRRMAQNQTEFFPVFGGDKLSAIINT